MPASHLSLGRTSRPVAIAIGLVVVSLGALTIAPPDARAAEHAVDISGFAFGPATLTVSVGDTVTWTNSDDAPHTATAENGAFDSGNMDTGATFSFTFSEPGTYTYRCDYHSEMQATIVVQAAAEAPAAPSTAPATTAPSTDATHTGGATQDDGQPDTALPVTSASPIAPLLIGLGLVALAFGFIPARATAPSRPRLQRSGWRR